MAHLDYIPRQYGSLQIWLAKFIVCLKRDLVKFGIPAGASDEVEAKIADFQAACMKVNLANAGSSDRVDREGKAEETVRAVRTFVNKYLRYNDAVTNADRESLGLTIPDRQLTASTPPRTAPDATVAMPGVACIKLTFRIAHSKSRGRPPHTRGCEIRHAILSTRPTSYDDLIHSTFVTHSPHTFTFAESQRGRTVYFSLRWESTRGEPGPWSAFVAAVVP
jgi:hypothetical protein